MNRSYSKIRHIQEVNQRLEKRMLSEQDQYKLDVVDPNQSQVDGNKLEQINGQLNQVGVTPLSTQDVVDLQSVADCPMEEPVTSDPQGEKILDQIKNNVESMKVGQILSDLKKLNSIRKGQKNVNEQLEALTIAGITIPGGLVMGIAGFIILLLLIKLVKLIFGGGVNPDCRKKNRLFRRFGPSGVA